MAVGSLVRQISENRVNNSIESAQQIADERAARAAELAQLKSGAQTSLFDDNMFSQFFDFVQYQDTGFSDYESLADPKTQKLPIRQLKPIAARTNPHFKAAMTDFQDYATGGWAFKNRTTVVDIFLDTMEDLFEGFDSYLCDIADNLFIHSAYFSESVYDDELRLRRMLANDVMTAEFRQDKTHPLGDRYVLGQSKGFSIGSAERWKQLQDDPTVTHRKLYSKPNYPYGVPFVDAALFHMVMMVEFFKSYRNLLESFVLPSLLIRVDREIINEMVERDPTKRDAFVRQVFDRLAEQVKKMSQDRGKGRVITMGSEVMEPNILSGMNEKTMGAAETLINALDNQLELALKTHGLTTLRNDSALNDTKAKYRMANYSRVIKRAQKVISYPHNRQFNIAHNEVGSDELCGFYLERNIYEDEQILAEISQTMSLARKEGYAAMDTLLEMLGKATQQGRLTESQANQMFIDEMEKITGNMDMASLDNF